MMNFPVSEPLSSAVLHAVRVPSDGFGVDCAWFVVCSHLCMEVSSNQHVCACLPVSVDVLLEFRVHLLNMLRGATS